MVSISLSTTLSYIYIHKLSLTPFSYTIFISGEDLGPFPFVVGNADSSDPEYVMAVKKVSLEWAIQQAHKLFFVAMDELIQKHPIDSLDDDGAPFWSGTRKIPRPLRFIPLDSEEDEVSAQQVIINERIAQFVSATARLRMESFYLLKKRMTIHRQ